MKSLILSTKYQGYSLTCYWHSLTKSVEFYAVNTPLKLHTGFGFISRFKTAKLSDDLSIEVHFRKLIRDKIAIIMLKVEGIILKAQAIEVRTGEKVSISSITYQQLTK